MINERSLWFGYNMKLDNTLFVKGSLSLPSLIHLEIFSHSYVCPCDVVTGHAITSSVRGQINSFGKSTCIPYEAQKLASCLLRYSDVYSVCRYGLAV